MDCRFNSAEKKINLENFFAGLKSPVSENIDMLYFSQNKSAGSFGF